MSIGLDMDYDEILTVTIVKNLRSGPDLDRVDAWRLYTANKIPCQIRLYIRPAGIPSNQRGGGDLASARNSAKAWNVIFERS